MRIASLSLLALCLTLAPSGHGRNIYDNGPANGNVDAWTINFGFLSATASQVSAATTLRGCFVSVVGSWRHGFQR